MLTTRDGKDVIELNRNQAITAIFALRNYICQLKSEIKTPTRPTGMAESAVALGDAEPLLKELEECFRPRRHAFESSDVPGHTDTCRVCGKFKAWRDHV